MRNNKLPIIITAIISQMEDADKSRESALPLHRQSIRESSLAIRATHRGNYPEAEEHLSRSKAYLQKATEAIYSHPEVLYAGFLQDAQKEFAEATITYRIITDSELVGPEDLSIANAPYLNGLAEAVGELRRHVLDRIRSGDYKTGERILEIMDEILFTLTAIDFPDAITRGLRRSTDIARSCLEKTRGDLTANYGFIRLEEEIDVLHKRHTNCSNE